MDILPHLTYRFNPRVLAGGRDQHTLKSFRVNKFQSTRPRGRTRPTRTSITSRCHVSIHASSREDATFLFSLRPGHGSFNPRVLAGGRDQMFHITFAQGLFQSTRPRGRTRRAGSGINISPERFNPRVLAGGRDLAVRLRRPALHVSIHASSREDATYYILIFPIVNGFQSTRPRGRTRRRIFHLPATS